jgi:predicted nucleotidyltransferase
VKQSRVLRTLIDDLTRALGSRLRSVVLYGSAAGGDFDQKTSDVNLLLVLQDLEPETLERLAPAIRRWRKTGRVPPRLFNRETIADSADVFPIELLDLTSRRVVLHGDDPFAGLRVGREHLRMQCERELREKLMRLREGYVEACSSRRALCRLLTASYTTFVALFRGCLRLLGVEPPASNREVVAAFCARAGIDAAAFEAVDRLKRREPVAEDPKAIFSRYHAALAQAVRAVDRFQAPQGGTTR